MDVSKQPYLRAMTCAFVGCFMLGSGTQADTGLDFPGSAAVPNSSTVRFRFVNPHTKGLPIYGPSGRGVTYIWCAYPRRQAGYYTAFFWGNDDGKGELSTFIWHNGGGDTYFGAHPYPKNPPSSYSLSDIAAEIATPLSSAKGSSSVWYLNVNPTPGDISDKSGKGNEPAWVGNLRPELWSRSPPASAQPITSNAECSPDAFLLVNGVVHGSFPTPRWTAGMLLAGHWDARGPHTNT